MSVVFEGPLAMARCDVAGCTSIRYIQAVQLAVDSRHPEKLTVAIVRRMLGAHRWTRHLRNCGLTAHYIDLCPQCARAAKRDGWGRRKQRDGLRSTVLETRDATYIDVCPECDRQYRLTCGPDTERGE